MRCIMNENPTVGGGLFTLFDAQGGEVLSREIDFTNIDDGCFCLLEVGQWIHKGEEYTFSICVSEEYDNLFYGIYTVEPSQAAPGSVMLSIGEEAVAGQALTRYCYGYPLNSKNVVCLWAFLLICGLSLYGLSGGADLHSRKLVILADRFQILILLLEIAGVLVLSALVCNTRTVDWDEAYSIRMITKYSFSEMFRVTALDIHPPLYYVLLRLYSMVFGTSVFALKMMSVAITALVMVLGITKVRKYWGPGAAFLFNLVAGLGPQFVCYSVNIRMYSLSLFFVMWCAFLAYEILWGGGLKDWILFVLSALGGVFTHYFNVVPLAFIYGYLLVGLWIFYRKKVKWFFVSCMATIVGYLPWLSIVVKTFQRAGVRERVSEKILDFGDLIRWAFSTNIEFSVYMPLILFVVALILLVAECKKYKKQELLFLVMCAANILFTYIGCRVIASINVHFWDNRYVFSAMGLFWLFLVIIYSRRGRIVFCAFALWLGIMSMSAFVIQKAKDSGTNAYMDATYKVLEQVMGEEQILYNYDTYQVLYGAHLREQEFIFIDDLDWESMDRDYIYMIAWGGHWFDPEVVQKYQLEAVDCGTMRFEEGVAGVKLYKIVAHAR